MYNIILNIVYVLIVSINIAIIINNIVTPKLGLKYTMGLIGVISIVSYPLLMYKEDRLAVPILTLIIIIYTYMCIRKVAYSILISVVTQIILASSDGLTGVIFMFIFRLNYSEIINIKSIYFASAFTILLLSAIISKLMNVFLRRSKYSKFMEVNNKHMLVLVISVSYTHLTLPTKA